VPLPSLWRRHRWTLNLVVVGSSPTVGAKLLVEIGPEGGRRHNSPLSVLPPPKGKVAEGPLGERRRNLVTNATSTNPSTTTF
jgi:hypothetical protein